MTLVLTNTSRWFDGQRLHQVGSIVVTGSYLTPLGEVLSLANPEIKSSRLPDFMLIQGRTGFTYAYNPNTDISDGTMSVFLAGVEASAGLYPGLVTGDVITYHAIFRMR